MSRCSVCDRKEIVLLALGVAEFTHLLIHVSGRYDILLSISTPKTCSISAHVEHGRILIEDRWALVGHAIVYWVVAYHLARVPSVEMALQIRTLL